jgi:hypothetical protein
VKAHLHMSRVVPHHMFSEQVACGSSGSHFATNWLAVLCTINTSMGLFPRDRGSCKTLVRNLDRVNLDEFFCMARTAAASYLVTSFGPCSHQYECEQLHFLADFLELLGLYSVLSTAL